MDGSTDLASMRNDLATATAALDRITRGVAALARRDKARGLVLDEHTYSVSHAGRSVRLGNWLAYRLLTCLTRRLGWYTELSGFKAVWGDPPEPAAVHAAVCRLRKTLRKTGLKQLATAIEAGRGCAYRINPEKL